MKRGGSSLRRWGGEVATVVWTAWVVVNMLLATGLVAGSTVVFSLCRIRRARFYDWVSWSWAVWILRISATPVRVEGLEHVRQDVPQIFVSNHRSWYDIFALAAVTPKRSRFVAKKELERIPLFGRGWKAAGHISVDRSDRASAKRSMEQAGRTIKEDESSVILFAEGTRSADGSLLPFKKGAFMLGIHTGIEIVPTAILGSGEIMPKGGWRIRPGPIMVRFGKPVRTEDYGEADRDKLSRVVRDRVQDLLGQESVAHTTCD